MIDRAIGDWISQIVAPQNGVIQMPYEGPRPANEYIGFQVLTVVPSEHSYKVVRELADSGKIDETRSFNATMTVSVNAYMQNGYNALNRLHASAEVFEARDILKSYGDDINLNGMIRQANLTGLGDEKFRPRHQGDFQFYITTDNRFEIYRLVEFTLSGKWLTPDDGETDTITISNSVNQIA